MNKKVSTSSNPHLLQSVKWQKYEELEGRQTLRLKSKDYALTAVLHETPLLNYLFIPYGPSAANKNALLKALRAVQKLAEQKNITFIRIEPTLALSALEMQKIAKKLGLKLKKSRDLDPAHTWLLDLTPEKDVLLKNMESRKVRYWKNHEKKGMKIRKTKNPEEITILTDLLKNLGEVDNFTPQDENHLKNQLKSGFATLYIVELENSPIAAALVYDFDKTRYYAHAATDFEHRKLAAGSILLIEMILDAKSEGKKFYDFWGITTSEDKNHPWYGFTQYKKSFGGYQVDYTGTYDLILDPGKYRLYSLLRRLNRSLRKITKK